MLHGCAALFCLDGVPPLGTATHPAVAEHAFFLCVLCGVEVVKEGSELLHLCFLKLVRTGFGRMSRNDADGSLGDVNPELLELSKDPIAWREQRRRALQAKVFGRGGRNGGVESSAASAHTKNISSGAGAPNTSCVADESRLKRGEHEAYVLEQLKSHRRRREDALKSEEAPARLVSCMELSTKEKLLQRLKNPK
ncbi:hypothetical protein TRSC58_05332 [Trypanosoma rangeli SC58]|uniref:Uncharacterized protein n=1 Tax=Trypanosoma rangeli SC58 TaxID=429131 RepID=A0A061IYP9_TRYRA|nr:hypothetical protein TRSC58_05332 [Trypanosoma rangeli SC58]